MTVVQVHCRQEPVLLQTLFSQFQTSKDENAAYTMGGTTPKFAQGRGLRTNVQLFHRLKYFLPRVETPLHALLNGHLSLPVLLVYYRVTKHLLDYPLLAHL